MAHLRTLSDDELLRLAHIVLDALTGTDLEAELLRRFEENGAVTAETEPLLKVLEDHGIDSSIALDKTLGALDKTLGALKEYDADQVGALLDVLGEFDIDDPAALKKALERNAKFDDLLQDLADPIASLHSLITTTE
jgi:hypothetical protein